MNGELEFYAKRQLTTANPTAIKRLRWVASDGGHGEPVACAVLTDGTVGRFLQTDYLAEYIDCLKGDIEVNGYSRTASMMPATVAQLRGIVEQRIPS